MQYECITLRISFSYIILLVCTDDWKTNEIIEGSEICHIFLHLLGNFFVFVHFKTAQCKLASIFNVIVTWCWQRLVCRASCTCARRCFVSTASIRSDAAGR